MTTNPTFDPVTYREMAKAHLRAAGLPEEQLATTLARLYLEALPTREQYEEAIREAMHADRELREQAVFLDMAEVLCAGDPARYEKLYRQRADAEARRQAGGRQYESELEKLPAFAPVPYENIAIALYGVPDEIHLRMYRRSVERAKALLDGTTQALNAHLPA